MSENDAISRISGINMPNYYLDYYTNLSTDTYSIFQHAAKAKSSLVDSSGIIEPKIAFDLADRVAKMHEIDIADPLRDLLKINGKELSALILSKEIALGKYSLPDATLEEKLDLAVRVGLAIVTEGVTIAPLQGISEVKIKKNKDGTDYLSVSIAGPMRSAGGTESAVTMLIADHVRKAAGLSKYQANSFDDETGRFVEELRIYEREASSFQFHILDEDIEHVISNLPVELDGVDTDPYEVVNHKSMARIKTDRVRGGALRVLNDGLIGRSKKLLKRIELYNLDGWEWLNDLKGAVQTGDNQEDAAAKRMREVITGRSVLSMPNKLGGFRLRYGRACNTGFAAVGIHPVIAEILDHTVAVGTQIKIDIPGKGATVAFVDSIDTPTVRLNNGDVVKIRDVKHALEIKNEIEKILHLGDILISFGDFLENNAQLVPSGYVEEFWIEELKQKTQNIKSDSEYLKQFLSKIPSVDEAIKISYDFKIPLHPHYLYFWDKISSEDLSILLEPTNVNEKLIEYPIKVKKILENLGTPHKIDNQKIILESQEAKIFFNLLFREKPTINDFSVPLIISKSSGIKIKNKFSTSVGVRIGRPEKAAARQMKPPTHVLFPVSDKGGPTRDLLKASRNEHFFANIYNRICDQCNEPSIGIKCSNCGVKTTITYRCTNCRDVLNEPFCEKCKRKAPAHSHKEFPLKTRLLLAQEKMGLRAKEPFKGVKELINQDKIAEPLEKGLTRQNFGLTTFKDGTVRFDATNSPLTQFKPSWIGTSIEKLKQLGYYHDIDGNPLENLDQIIELRMQDVIIPYESGKYLVSTCKYIDALLQKFYGTSAFYNVNNSKELIGHLIIGLAPHTSVGIVGRIIGYTETHVCFATPNWHSAKRRDADGDADSIMLLMDSLLNFSRQFLSDRIGGLMDAPLLVQPLVLPHESQPQAHNLEVTKFLPLEFFESTFNEIKASDINSVDIIKSRLETERQFYDYFFTHPTSSLTTSKSRSAYSTLGSMLDKFDMQVKNADLIDAVNTSEIVSNVISTHLVPDIMGNLRAYARQNFRCTACGKSYRRMPLIQTCICGHKLIATITRGSVEKYLKLAKRLVEKYDVSEYQRGRIHALSDEIELVFGKNKGDQSLLTDYA
ncbi:DNA polymerase II large subunit [Nitrosopumilus adriaticus]|uniref:DNA polymerase II large subunit n=1 Tax=Nitrosopumilus adriaticus TaxID=1580092 RepID=A0A0D5BZN0_9ARCH|nr:DNA polymerase II large subunit [Nitrosopumilus adriaticus]AJW69773.1 DNA polymerase II large subunit [Nitrosopumilus adriaticus]